MYEAYGGILDVSAKPQSQPPGKTQRLRRLGHFVTKKALRFYTRFYLSTVQKLILFMQFAVAYDDYSLIISLSNKRVHVVKKKTQLNESLIDMMN
jgi:hypothetical protein